MFSSILGSAPVAIVLTTIVWVVMYYAFPDAPLNAAETTLLLFVFTALTALVRNWLKRSRPTSGDKPDAPSDESSHG